MGKLHGTSFDGFAVIQDPRSREPTAPGFDDFKTECFGPVYCRNCLTDFSLQFYEVVAYILDKFVRHFAKDQVNSREPYTIILLNALICSCLPNPRQYPFRDNFVYYGALQTSGF